MANYNPYNYREVLTSIADSFNVAVSDADAVHVSRLLSGIAAIDDGRFASWSKIDAASKAGDDPLLYKAFRDVVPSCSTHRPTGTLGEGQWHGDLVFYSGTSLADGEPCRSAGHWNPSTQVEAFQVLEGSITMLIATGDLETPALLQTTAQRSEVVVMLPGCWHLTYAPHAPAAVFNVYTAPVRVNSNIDNSEKYKFRSPVPVWLTATDDEDSLTWSGDGHKQIVDASSSLLLAYGEQGIWLDALLRHGDRTLLNRLVTQTEALSRSSDGTIGRDNRVAFVLP